MYAPILCALDFLVLFLLMTEPSSPKVEAIFGSTIALCSSIYILAFCLELFLEGIDGTTLELCLSKDDFFAKKSYLFTSTSFSLLLITTILSCCSITKLFC